jgi:hypothetical protein
LSYGRVVKVLPNHDSSQAQIPLILVFLGGMKIAIAGFVEK